MVMEYVSGGELFDYILKHGKVCNMKRSIVSMSLFIQKERKQLIYKLHCAQLHSCLFISMMHSAVVSVNIFPSHAGRIAKTSFGCDEWVRVSFFLALE